MSLRGSRRTRGPKEKERLPSFFPRNFHTASFVHDISFILIHSCAPRRPATSQCSVRIAGEARRAKEQPYSLSWRGFFPPHLHGSSDAVSLAIRTTFLRPHRRCNHTITTVVAYRSTLVCRHRHQRIATCIRLIAVAPAASFPDPPNFDYKIAYPLGV